MLQFTEEDYEDLVVRSWWPEAAVKLAAKKQDFKLDKLDGPLLARKRKLWRAYYYRNIEFMKMRKAKYHQEKKLDPEYQARKAANALAWKEKHKDLVLARRKATYNKNMLDPAYKARRALATKNYRARLKLKRAAEADTGSPG